jgi:hypothetical protein
MTTERYVSVYEGPGTPPRATPKQSTASGPHLQSDEGPQVVSQCFELVKSYACIAWTYAIHTNKLHGSGLCAELKCITTAVMVV